MMARAQVSLTAAQSATLANAVTNNQPSVTFGTISGNGSGLTNLAIPASISSSALANYPDSYRIITTNFLPPLTSMEWSDWAGDNFAGAFGGIVRYNGTNWLMGDNNTPETGTLYTSFAVPQGTTNVTLTLVAASQSSTIAPTFAYYNGSGFLVNITPTLTTAFSTNTIVQPIISSVTNLYCFLKLNGANTGMIIQRLDCSVLPQPTNLPSPFVRYQVLPEHIQNNAGSIAVNGVANYAQWRFFTKGASSASYVDFQCAGNPVLEFRNNPTVGPQPGCSVMINGVTFTNFTQGNSYDAQLMTIYAPSNQLNSFRVFNSFSQNGMIGTMFRAIYTATNYPVTFTPAEPPFRAFVIGDSISAGAYTTNNDLTIWSQIRQWSGAKIAINASGSARITDLTNSTTLQYVIQQAAVQQPNIIWLALGVNDVLNSTFSDTNSLALSYGTLLDTFHSAFPAATIYAQSPTFYTGSGTNLTNYSLAISSAVSNRLAYARYVNALAWIGATDLGDTVHPNTFGKAKIAWHISTNIIRNVFPVTPQYYPHLTNGIVTLTPLP